MSPAVHLGKLSTEVRRGLPPSFEVVLSCCIGATYLVTALPYSFMLFDFSPGFFFFCIINNIAVIILVPLLCMRISVGYIIAKTNRSSEYVSPLHTNLQVVNVQRCECAFTRPLR